MRANLSRSRVDADEVVDPFAALAAHDPQSANGGSWFVYLLPLSDCSSFKVGFTCNPLQRIASFSRRFFERFDLHESRLLQLNDCEGARAVEATLKAMLEEYRCESPTWIPPEAGGHTEWFSAVYFADAADSLLSLRVSYAESELIETADFIRAALLRHSNQFERWAYYQAQRLCDDRVSISLGYEPTAHASGLRDWFDTYRFFAVPLFSEEQEIAKFIVQSVQRRVG